MFNSSKFDSTKFEARTGAITIDGLRDFFDEDEEPEFVVRSLTHAEVAQCAEGAQSDPNLKALLEAAAGHTPAIKGAVQEMLGKVLDVPVDTKKRILHLTKGSVEPKIDEGTAVKLAETFPIEFTLLTNKILELTGLGQVAVKKQ